MPAPPSTQSRRARVASETDGSARTAKVPPNSDLAACGDMHGCTSARNRDEKSMNASSTVIDLDDRLGTRFPPLRTFEVEGGDIALWLVVRERLELISTVWRRAGLGPHRWDLTVNQVCAMKARDEWSHDSGRWTNTLSAINAARLDENWRMPPTQTFADLDSLGRALAGCLHWHALAEHGQIARKKSHWRSPDRAAHPDPSAGESSRRTPAASKSRPAAQRHREGERSGTRPGTSFA